MGGAFRTVKGPVHVEVKHETEGTEGQRTDIQYSES